MGNDASKSRDRLISPSLCQPFVKSATLLFYTCPPPPPPPPPPPDVNFIGSDKVNNNPRHFVFVGAISETLSENERLETKSGRIL